MIPTNPFPYDRLPRLRRSDVTWRKRVRPQLGADPQGALRRWVESYLGADLRETPRLEATPRSIEGSEQRGRLLAGAAMSVTLRAPGELSAAVHLDSKLVSSLLGLLLRAAAVPLSSRPTPAEQGLVAYALAGLLLELGPDCPWTVEVEPQPQSEANPQLVIEARVRLSSTLGGTAWLIAPELGSAQPRTSSPMLNRKRLELLRFMLPVAIGRFPISLHELDLLGAGDVILSPGCPRRQGPWPAALCVGAGGFPLTVEGQHGRIDGLYSQGAIMSQTAGDRSAVADQLPVEIVVELGRIGLSGAQIMDLAVGDVVLLERPIVSPVDLRAGDRLIARAELVEVEGETGVRLLEVYD